MEERRLWDKNCGQGQGEILRAMLNHNDLTFIHRYLTPEFCAENRLHVRGRDEEGDMSVSSEEFSEVRTMIVRSLTNLGQPKLSVVNANHGNRGELVVFHAFDGQELNLEFAKATCRNLQKLWGRPVHVLSREEEGNKFRLTHNGERFDSANASSEFVGYFDLDR